MLNIPLYKSNLTYGLKLNILFSLMNNKDNLIFGNSYRIYYYKKIYEIQTDGPKEIKRIENYYYSIDNYVDSL